jgi:hypothetical protein
MSDQLSRIWAGADLNESGFSGDDAATREDGVEAKLLDAGLLERIEHAQSVVCDACAEGHVEEVTFIESPSGSPVRAYLRCPEHGRVPVPLDRLSQWRIDFEGLARAVASSLDLAGEVELLVADRLWRLGSGHLGGRTREVFFGRGLGWPDAAAVIGGSPAFQAARTPLILVPGATPPREIFQDDSPPVVTLSIVAELVGNGVSIDQSRLESFLFSTKRPRPRPQSTSFPTPSGVGWPDVFMTIADFSVEIEAGGKTREYSFQEAGFESEKQQGLPVQEWHTLTVIAMRGGMISSDDEHLDDRVRNNLKQSVSKLRGRLRALIPKIDGDPISFDDAARCYRATFGVSSAETVRFPTPSGTGWSDVSISHVRTDIVRIGVDATEVFGAHGHMATAGHAVHHWEAAERASTLSQDYPLRVLGLTTEDGEPDDRGAALLSVLESGGTIRRGGDDEAMLGLCEFLTDLMGLDDSPFDFASISEEWVTRFHVLHRLDAGHF